MRTVLTCCALVALLSSALLAADAKAGKEIYVKACKSCHGADGTPNAGVAKMMKVEMRDLKSTEVQALSDADVEKIVVAGKGKMKPVTSVTGASSGDVAAYVHTLKK